MGDGALQGGGRGDGDRDEDKDGGRRGKRKEGRASLPGLSLPSPPNQSASQPPPPTRPTKTRQVHITIYLSDQEKCFLLPFSKNERSFINKLYKS